MNAFSIAVEHFTLFFFMEFILVDCMAWHGIGIVGIFCYYFFYCFWKEIIPWRGFFVVEWRNVSRWQYELGSMHRLQRLDGQTRINCEVVQYRKRGMRDAAWEERG